MALQIHTTYSFINKPYHHHLPCTTFLLSPTRKPKFTVKYQNPQIDAEPTNERAPPKKPTSSGQGFGSSSASISTGSKSNVSAVSNKKKQKGIRERASIIRRAPVQKPELVSKEEEIKAKEQSKNESAFLLAWLGLGGIILVEGIVLAASGFLPEKWDKFFVKYLYPSFTPTVALFVAGTVTYGVSKYLQNEKLRGQK